MRNLKRVLSLALALVMILGVMITTGLAAPGEGQGGQGGNGTSEGAPADNADVKDAADEKEAEPDGFVDADKIDAQYAEAVTVMTGIGILEGDENRNFNPNDILSREQAAKIIAYLVLGADAAELVSSNAVTAAFDDVTVDRWSSGYIAYCANTGYIHGYGNGSYGPEDELTGVAFAKMLLVALGYDAEVEDYVNDADWATNVAIDAADAGITLTGVLLSAPLSREQAAQMAFQALEADVVEYENKGMEVISTDGTVVRTGVKGPYAVKSDNTTAYDGKKDSVTQLVEKLYPKLVKFNDVVTGNEYADLNSDEPLAKGTSVIGGATYNVTTTLDDIGESRQGWAYGKDILVIKDSGKNTVEEFTAKAELKKSVKMNTGKDTESYVNFASSSTTTYTALYRIVFDLEQKLNANQVQELKDNKFTVELISGNEYTISKTIKADGSISATDRDIIRTIFAEADENNGHVYVGTQESNDISNRISFRDFWEKYVETTVTPDAVTGNENGNYVKVIDNDGDGVAEYILKTVYTLAAITDVSEKSGYTLTGEDESVKTNAVVTEDELDEGDVIVYALIDGVYYTNLAEVVTDTVNTKGVDYKNETITCGETTYGQSGIDVNRFAFNNAFLNDIFEFEVTEAASDMEYDFYLDNYGYVRAFTLNRTTSGLGLLTNAYYSTDRKTDVYKVDMVTPSTEETTYVLNNTRSDTSYIDTTEGDSGDRSTWDRLIGFQNVLTAAQEQYGLHTFATNVVGYSGSAESLIILNPTGTINSIHDTYIQRELNMNIVSSLSTEKYSGINSKDNSKDTIYATTDTDYYYVARNGNVTTWTGYKNAPDSVTLRSDDIAYTVAHKSTSDKYYVADVIVIEQQTNQKSASFLYDAYNRNTGAVVTGISVTKDGADTSAITSELTRVTGNIPAFFEITKTAATEVTSNFADYNIFAAESQTSRNVNSRDYVYLSANPGVSKFLLSDVDVYKVNSQNGSYSIGNCSTITAGDALIYVTDGSKVVYVINVSESVDKQDKIVGKLDDLYDAIKRDQKNDHGDVDVTFFGQEAVFTQTASTTGANDVAGTYTLTVSYADARQYADQYSEADFLKVAYGKIVTGDKAVKGAVTDGVTYRGTILSETGKYYNFVLTQSKAVKVASLTDKTTTYNVVSDTKTLIDYYNEESHGTNVAPSYYELTLVSNLTIQDYLNLMELSENAIVKWYFETRTGENWTFITHADGEDGRMNVPDLDDLNTNDDGKLSYAGVAINEIKYVYALVTADDGKTTEEYMNKAYYEDRVCHHDADVTVSAAAATLDTNGKETYVKVDSDKKTITIPEGLTYTKAEDLIQGTAVNNHTENIKLTLSADKKSIRVTADTHCARGHKYDVTYTIVEEAPVFIAHWRITEDSAKSNIVRVNLECVNYVASADGTTVYAPGKSLNRVDLKALVEASNLTDGEIRLFINTSTDKYGYEPVDDAGFTEYAAGIGYLNLRFSGVTMDGAEKGWFYNVEGEADNVNPDLTISNVNINIKDIVCGSINVPYTPATTNP